MAYPTGTAAWTVTWKVTQVVPAYGIEPSVQPAEPPPYEPASSPAASVTGAPATVSEPGTYVVKGGIASASVTPSAVSLPALRTAIRYSMTSPGSRSPPFRSVPVTPVVMLGA